jgi:hypothetical protein
MRFITGIALAALQVLVFASCGERSTPFSPLESPASSPLPELAAGWRILAVSPRGSDSNAGTPAAPFRTVQKAVNAARPGDYILLRAGTYSGPVVIEGKSGSPGAPITMRPWGDGPVTLTASFPARSCGETDPTRDRTVQILDGSDHWVIQGLAIVNGVLVQGSNVGSLTDGLVRNRNLPGRGLYDPQSAARTLESVGVDGADGVKLLYNRITRRGIFVASARRGWIVGNDVGHIDCGTGAGIWINAFSDFWYVQGNFVHHTAASQKHFMSEGIRMGRASMYNTIESNVVQEMGGLGRGITTDVQAGWNLIRWNRVSRAEIGYSEQAGGWGNRWIGNVSESNRKYGFAMFSQGGKLRQPTDDVPNLTQMTCNEARAEKIALRIGGAQRSRFASNAFSLVKMGEGVKSYWKSAGNTWDGSSALPPERPRASRGGC